MSELTNEEKLIIETRMEMMRPLILEVSILKTQLAAAQEELVKIRGLK